GLGLGLKLYYPYAMLKRIKIPPGILFLAPVGAAIALLAFLNISCQSNEGGTSGSLKILYTSEVGGRIDPCG
ncbi:MAG: hypothetical protein JSV70_07100, partial [bacterium]